jgi:hypothetical protein
MADLFMNKKNMTDHHEKRIADFFINKKNGRPLHKQKNYGQHCTWTRDWAVDSAVQSSVSNVLKKSNVIYL